ncbi:MAG: hypothetical protein ACRYFX_25435 [Janthinobacterium lividum]
MGAKTTTGLHRNLLLLLPLLLALLAGCRTCPLDTCHVRKAHYHNGVKYRARPFWKMQYPAIGERIKVNKQSDGGRKSSDHSKPLK